MKFRKTIVWILLILLLTNALTVQATNSVNELEATTSDLENELSNLNSDLSVLEAEMDSVLFQIRETSATLDATKSELALAKGMQDAQYESMKLRIQYMYENGNHSIMEMLLSSGSLAEFLNHAEYYSSIMEYDRTVLEEYKMIQEDISRKEQELLDTQTYLLDLQASLDAREQELNDKISDTSADLSSYKAKLAAAKEEAKKAEEAAKEEIIPVPPPEPDPKPEPEPEPEIEPDVEVDTELEIIPEPEVQPDEEPSEPKESILDTASDLEIFAGLLECEAGYQDYDALLAVGSVIVNRMNSTHYPDTLRGVIFQSGQFPPATNGKLERILERGVKDLCVTAAQDALGGKNNIGDCLQFRSKNSGHVGTVIGNNVFF